MMGAPMPCRGWLVIFLVLATCLQAAADERKDEMRALLAQGTVVYYGREPQDKSNFHKAKVIILEPAHWTSRSIRKLREEGKVVLGYLSVGELISSTRTGKNYRVLSKNDSWDSLRIDPSDLQWKKTMLRRTRLAKERQLDGMMLDTVDIVTLHPEVAEPMAELVADIRAEMPDRYLVMNRGFSVLKDVHDVVDGVIFENANNRQFSANDRSWITAQCAALKRHSMPVLLLDYSESCDPTDTASMAEEYGWSYYLADSVELAKPPFGPDL
jgi:hypothetical protein